MSGLELQSVRVLRGPNLWARVPVLDLKLCVTLDDRTPAQAGHVCQTRVLGWWSALTDPSRIAEGPGAVRSRADFQSLRNRCGTCATAEAGPGLFLANLLTEVALTLQTLAGTGVAFGRVLPAGPSNLYQLIVEYEEEELARACLAVSRDLCEAAIRGQPAELVDAIKHLREVADDVCLGPSTLAIVQAARRREIPIRRLNAGSLVQLGQGIHQHRICAAETDRTGAIGETIASDKELTKRLLKAVGVPVPAGRLVSDAEDAWRATCELGGPVVVKPLNGNHGRAVFIGLTKREETTPAYELACTEGDGVIVERAISGAEHRLLVVGQRVAAATRGDPVYVVGDGTLSIRELVAELNRDPRRGDDEADCPLAELGFGSPNRATLAQQGYKPESVPPAGARVLLQRNGNLAIDVTDRVHPENAATAVLAARTVGLDIAGVDFVTDDIAVPLREQGGAVVEVNAGPGLQMHLRPAEGTPRPVGEAVVASLFPGDTTGHVPIVAVQDSPHSAAIAQLIGRMLGVGGVRVGVACAEGVFIDQRQTASGNATDARSAADLLLHPSLEAAVFETSEAGAVSEGLGFDRCQVAVLAAGDGAEHRAIDSSQSPPVRDALRQALIQTVVATGALVVPADALAAEPPTGPACIPWAPSADHPVVAAHRRRGGKAVFLQDGAVILADGSRAEPVAVTEHRWLDHDLPLLASVAAAWALGRPATAIRTALASWLAERT